MDYYYTMLSTKKRHDIKTQADELLSLNWFMDYYNTMLSTKMRHDIKIKTDGKKDLSHPV